MSTPAFKRIQTYEYLDTVPPPTEEETETLRMAGKGFATVIRYRAAMVAEARNDAIRDGIVTAEKFEI